MTAVAIQQSVETGFRLAVAACVVVNLRMRRQAAAPLRER